MKGGVREPALWSDGLGLNPDLPFTSSVSLANLPSFSVPLGLTICEELGLAGAMSYLEAHCKGQGETKD